MATDAETGKTFMDTKRRKNHPSGRREFPVRQYAPCQSRPRLDLLRLFLARFLGLESVPRNPLGVQSTVGNFPAKDRFACRSSIGATTRWPPPADRGASQRPEVAGPHPVRLNRLLRWEALRRCRRESLAGERRLQSGPRLARNFRAQGARAAVKRLFAVEPGLRTGFFLRVDQPVRRPGSTLFSLC